MANIQTRTTVLRAVARVAALIAVIGLACCGGGANEGNTVDEGAIAAVTADPPVLTGSGVSTITWSSTHALSCDLSGVPVAVNGSYTTPTLSSTTTYTLKCQGADGGWATREVQISVSSTPPTAASTLASVAAVCAAAPVLPGTVRYYCDCGTGAQSGCVAGSDSNPGAHPAQPRRTIADAATFLNSQAAANSTVALCKGGAFDATGTLSLGSTRCAAGTTCIDLREYTPATFAGTAKPVINNVAGAAPLIFIDGNIGGVRLLNIKLNGDHGAIANGNRGIFLYEGAHDVTLCNLDMDGFDVAVYNESNAGVNSNIKLTGNRITNSRSMGYLGSGNNAEISYNHWDGNGNSTVFDHTLYLSSQWPVSNVQVIGNYIHGQWGSTCLGNPINVQGQFDGLAVNGNEVSIDASAVRGGCWGISLADGGYSVPVYFRHASVSGNIVRNGGNQPLSVQSCPGCLIENNLVIQDWFYDSGSGAWPLAGIVVPAAFRPGDDVNTANIVRNNTVYFGPSASGGGTGITVWAQGASHVIANNTVYYSASAAGQWFNCFDYPLALSSYAFINNNHCQSATPYAWEATHGSLDAWRTHAGASGFDSVSITGNPVFNSAGTDFTPASGSLLVGKGDPARGATSDIAGKVRPVPPAIGAYER